MRRLHVLMAMGVWLAIWLPFGAKPVQAAELTIGRATEQNSLDPQFSDLGNDVATAENMFESMIEFEFDAAHPSEPGGVVEAA